MLVEIAQPVSLLACLLSLYAVFHRAFLMPAGDLEQRLSHSLSLLALSACICLVSGLLFQETASGRGEQSGTVFSTLPVQLFCWAAGILITVFVLAWYLETHCIFYRDVRRL